MKYIIASILAVALSSCAELAGVDGSISYRDPNTGIEGGLVLTDGKPSGKVTAPIYDDAGNIIGRVEVGTKPKVQATK
jgi:hypothetical protein